MKRTIFFLAGYLTILISFSSCIYDFTQSISGNGNVKVESREVADFNSIDVSRGLQVHIVFGEPKSLEIEADENLHDVIRTEVTSGTLRIYSEKNIRNAKAKKIHISVQTLQEIEASSAARVTGENILNTDRLVISASSAAEIRLESDAEEIEVDASSSGSVDIKGSAEELDVDVSSAGSVDADKLQARYCNVTASSAGNASVWATEELKAEASSAGNIRYKGNPSNKQVNSSSAGSISQK
jgi:hypothetical protein